MRAPTVLFSIAVGLSLIGCSTEDVPTKTAHKDLVPATGAEVVASPKFKLEHTTKTGVEFYTRTITPDDYRAIPAGSKDHEYLQGDESFAFFVIPIRDGQIVELTTQDWIEVTGLILHKMAHAP